MRSGTEALHSEIKQEQPKMRGAEIVVRSLIKNGADTIFGYPGGAVLHIYDALWRFREQISHYLVRHEQGATHAAEGYARATGKVGVVLVTSGPGATNAVTGIATAYMDSIPLVVITGQVPSTMIGTDAFQEVDTFGITLPIVKHSYLVKDVRSIERIIDEAFQIAQSGKPGPVVIDIPKDITAELAEFSGEKTPFHSIKETSLLDNEALEQVIEKLLEAKKPVFYVGGGVVTANAADELIEVAETLQIPVTPTLMGLGGFPSAHENCLGMLGMHGTYTANMAVAESDLLFAVGVRFDDRVTGKLATFAPHAEVVHIDISPSNIGKIRKANISLLSDAKTALRAIAGELKNRSQSELNKSVEGRENWWKEIRAWQKSVPLNYCESLDTEIKPQQVIEELYHATKGDAVIVTDVGQHQMWAAQFYPFKRSRQWLTSGGLGTMGFGLPAAMGAQLALPQEQVVAIVGDGGFQMTNQEITTAIQYDIPLKVIIMNNGYLGMVRQWQEMFYERAYSEVDLSVSPDFVKLAEAHGALGLRAKTPVELKEVLEKGLKYKGATIMDIVVTKEENVFPIVPAGGNSRDMILKQ